MLNLDARQKHSGMTAEQLRFFMDFREAGRLPGIPLERTGPKQRIANG